MSDPDVTSEHWIAAELPQLTDLAPLARGGFGVVYTARQAALGRAVAVKVLTAPVLDETARLRFERECKAMGMLSDHPNILTVFEAGFTPSGRPYLVMELMPGGSLRDHLDRAPLPWEDVLDVAVRVGAALETAHRAGILHRDIKPENIMLSAYGEPQLGDFGIARLQGGPETRTDSLTASIAHVSPELLSGARPSRATDIYALGSTLFMLLAGRSAFLRAGEESIVPALARIAQDPVPDLRPAGVPDPVAAYIERLMAKDPAARPQTAERAAEEAQLLQQRLGLPATPIRIPDLPEELAARAPDDPLQDTQSVADVDATTTLTPPGSATRPAAVSAPTAPVRAPAGDPADATTVLGPPSELAASSSAAGLAPGTATVDVGPPPAGALVGDRPPGGGRRTAVLVGLAALLVVGGVGAFLLLRGPGAGPEQATPTAPTVAGGPTGPATAATAATAPPTAPATGPATAGPTATADPAQGAPLDPTATAQQLAGIRGLEPPPDVTAVAVPLAAYDPRVRAFGLETAPDLEQQDRILTALHALPADVDLVQLWQDLLAEQFLGYYDAAEELVVVKAPDAELSALERSILADELTAALLDHAFDLEGFLAVPDHDASRARLSLVRGDQLLTSSGWIDNFLTQAEQQERAADFGLLPDTVGRSAPPAVRQNLVFPFIAGNTFVQTLLEAADGGIPLLDEAYVDPPATTEQILHPDRYAAREPAVPVSVTATPGEGWEDLVDRSFGEVDLVQLLLPLDADPIALGQAGRADALGDGWGGGRLAAWTRGEETAVAVWLEFDAEAEAAEVCAALPEWYGLVTGGAATPAVDGVQAGPDDAFALRCAGTTVRLALAPDAAAAGLLAPV